MIRKEEEKRLRKKIATLKRQIATLRRENDQLIKLARLSNKEKFSVRLFPARMLETPRSTPKSTVYPHGET